MHSAIIRDTPNGRSFAYRLVDCAPVGSIVEVKPPRRTIPQNDRLWAMLTQISAAKPEGRTLTPDVWKSIFMHSLDHEQRFEMALDGRGFVPLGFRSSKLSKAQMSDLMTFIEEYAARNGVELDQIPQGAVASNKRHGRD